MEKVNDKKSELMNKLNNVDKKYYYIGGGVLATILLIVIILIVVGNSKSVSKLDNLETYSLSESGYFDLASADTQREKNISLGEITISGKKETLYLISDADYIKTCSNGKEPKTAIYMDNKYLSVSCEFDVINSVYVIDDDTIGITGVATASQEDKKYEPLTIEINSKGEKKEEATTVKNISVSVPDDKRIVLSNFTTDDSTTNLTISGTNVSIKQLSNTKSDENNILVMNGKEIALLKYDDEILLNLYVIDNVVAVESSSVTHQDVAGATIMRFYKEGKLIGELQSPGFFAIDSKLSCLDPEEDGSYTRYSIEISDDSVRKVKAN